MEAMHDADLQSSDSRSIPDYTKEYSLHQNLPISMDIPLNQLLQSRSTSNGSYSNDFYFDTRNPANMFNFSNIGNNFQL